MNENEEKLYVTAENKLATELLKMDNLTGVGAFKGGEAELEGSEVVPCSMAWFAVFFDGAEELAHGSLEAGIEP